MGKVEEKQGGALACPSRPRRPMPAEPDAALPPPHAALSFLLRPPGGTHPRTRHLGHFSRRRKVFVLRRTKGGVPVLPGRGWEGGALAGFSLPAAQ